jgi:hypothetical protein
MESEEETKPPEEPHPDEPRDPGSSESEIESAESEVESPPETEGGEESTD